MSFPLPRRQDDDRLARSPGKLDSGLHRGRPVVVTRGRRQANLSKSTAVYAFRNKILIEFNKSNFCGIVAPRTDGLNTL